MNPTLVLAAILLVVFLATLEPGTNWRRATLRRKDRR